MASNKIGSGSGWADTVLSITAPQTPKTESKWKNIYQNLRKDKQKDLRNGYVFEKKPPKQSTPSPSMMTEKTDSPVSTISKHSKSNSTSSSVSTSGKKSPTTLSGIKMFQNSDTQTEDLKKNTDTTDECIMALALACIIMLPMAIITVLVGLATPFWYNTGTGNLGLFQMCYTTSGTCDSANSYLSTVSSTGGDTWRVVASLAVVGVSLFVVALIFLCLYMSCKAVDNKKICTGVIICFLLFTGAGCVISGVALAISLYTQIGSNYALGWSFYLTAIGGGIGFTAFVVFAIHVCTLVLD